jgi:hypothetical protein
MSIVNDITNNRPDQRLDSTGALHSGTGTMTAQERDLLLEMLVSSQRRLIAATVELGLNQWTFAPGPERWSIAQCAQHLTLSEDALLGIVRKQVLEAAANPGAAATARGRDGVVVGAMRDRSQRHKTFDFLVPQTIASSPAAFINSLLVKRAETMQYVRESGDNLHHHFAPLGPLGDLDGYQWLLLLASHTDRHVAQMEEVKTQPQYPG